MRRVGVPLLALLCASARPVAAAVLEAPAYVSGAAGIVVGPGAVPLAAPGAAPGLSVPTPLSALASPALAPAPAPAAAASAAALPVAPAASFATEIPAVRAAAAPFAPTPRVESAPTGRAVFDGARDPASSLADPRRAVQLETVNSFWDERHLAVTRLPVVVGSLRDRTTFSRLLRGVGKIQSMTIKKPGTGLLLPSELEQFREAIETAFSYEKSINPRFDEYSAYLNVAQGPVAPGASQKRPNAHTDGYPRRPEDRGEIDRMYLVSDALPTEFFDQPFPIPQSQDFAAIHMTFENAADPARVVAHAPYAMTMMDSYTVHRSAKAVVPVYRTFLQVHFSARRFDMAQNTPNPLFEPAPKRSPFPDLARDWAGYASRYRAAASPVVAEPRAFFADVFELGKLWWTKTLWGRRISLPTAQDAARRAVLRHFEARAPGSAAAFAAYAARVLSPQNPESPNTKRKRLGYALIEASLLPPAEAAPYFDGLLNDAERRADAEYRRAVQPAVLASFRSETEALLAAKAAARPDFNVAAVLLSGSYAHGSAKASSDFDILVLTRDGTGRDVPEFMAELAKLRAARGWPAWKDWERYPDGSNILGVDDPLTRRFVAEMPTVVVAADAAVDARLAAVPAARPHESPTLLEIWYARLAGPFHRWRVRRALARLP